MTCDDSTRLAQVSVPEEEPVSLAEAKQFLRIEHDADDAAIARAITAARQAGEHYLRCAFLPQQWSYAAACPMREVWRLPVGPIREIASIVAVDAEGEEEVLEEETYRPTLDGFGIIFRVLPGHAHLRATFTAGLAGEAEGVPALIRQGMLHHVAAMLTQREGFVPMPAAALSCYQPHRRVVL